MESAQHWHVLDEFRTWSSFEIFGFNILFHVWLSSPAANTQWTCLDGSTSTGYGSGNPDRLDLPESSRWSKAIIPYYSWRLQPHPVISVAHQYGLIVHFLAYWMDLQIIAFCNREFSRKLNFVTETRRHWPGSSIITCTKIPGLATSFNPSDSYLDLLISA